MGLTAGIVAASVLVLGAAACSAPHGTSGSGADASGTVRPTGRSTPTPEPTGRAGTTAPAPSLANGRIQDVEDYLARLSPACEECFVEGGAFDQDTATLLVTIRATGSANLVGIGVVGPDRLLAALSCTDDVDCRGSGDDVETVGPGARELTILSSGHEVDVIGYDGTARRTIDLSSVLDGSSEIRDLAWSPDGDRLAVTTRELSTGLVSHVWLVDRDGGNPQRVHTASYTGPLAGAPLGYIWSLAWSPDGRRLGFIEERARLANSSEESLALRAVSLLLPGPGEPGPGTPRTLYDYATRPFDEAAFLWSPDGTRAAVRLPGQVLELSAEDGGVLARHPVACTWDSGSCPSFIWPARQP